MKENNAYDFPLDGEPDELSPEDEEFLAELETELSAAEEPDPGDAPLDLDAELALEFPELSM